MRTIHNTAIATKIQGVIAITPLKGNLSQSVIKALGTTLDRIVINGLANAMFYAKTVLRLNGERVEVDCRPSYGLASATITEAAEA